MNTAPERAGLARSLQAWAEREPGSVALESPEGGLTYRELAGRAGRMAEVLRAEGVLPGDRVAVCLPPGPGLVTAVAATVWAGAAYVPIDPGHPPARRRAIVEDAGAKLLLAGDGPGQDPLPEGTAVLAMDTVAQRIAEAAGGTGPVPVPPGAVGYVCYTSGTTGAPKGIAVAQDAVLDLVTDSDYVSLTPRDRVAQAANPAFDAFTFELWGALCNGARLVVVDRQTLLDPGELARRVRESGLTVMFLTTAVFNQVAHAVPEAFAPMRTLLTGGEAADPGAVRAVLAAGGPQRLLNVYGPTEATTFALWHHVERLDAAARTVPVGRPLRRAWARVLDDRLREAPPGAVGELYLGGPGLAYGYWDDQAATAGRFVADPLHGAGQRMYRTGDLAWRRPDGIVEFHGRTDDQVKIRGFRVELGEVESCLLAHPQVAAAAVTVREEDGGPSLTAYVTAASGAGDDLADTAGSWLRRRLPGYTVPSAVVVLDRLPLTGNGKVDRAALPAAATTAPAGAATAPRTALESALAVLWAELTGRRLPGVHDDFFAYGGNSLLAGRLRVLIRRALGADLPLRELFERTTVAEQAEALMLRERAPGTLEAAAGIVLKVVAPAGDQGEPASAGQHDGA